MIAAPATKIRATDTAVEVSWITGHAGNQALPHSERPVEGISPTMAAMAPAMLPTHIKAFDAVLTKSPKSVVLPLPSYVSRRGRRGGSSLTHSLVSSTASTCRAASR
jgi:hypothetical protein